MRVVPQSLQTDRGTRSAAPGNHRAAVLPKMREVHQCVCIYSDLPKRGAQHRGLGCSTASESIPVYLSLTSNSTSVRTETPK